MLLECLLLFQFRLTNNLINLIINVSFYLICGKIRKEKVGTFMIKIDIISGFLGAGKTTIIKKLFESSFKNEKVVLIENEFGEINIDSSFLKGAGVEIKEIRPWRVPAAGSDVPIK